MALTEIKTSGIDDDAVTAAKIANGAIDSTDQLTNGVVTAAKMEQVGASNDGKYLRANNGAPCSWETVSAGTTLSGSTDNTVVTVTGANAIQGEANLTYNGTALNLAGTNSEIHLMGSGTCDHSIAAPSGTNDVVVTANKDAENVTANIVFKSSGSGGGAVSEKARIDSAGRLLVGHTASETTYYTGNIQVQGTNSSTSAISIKSNQNDSGGPALVLSKSRGSLGGTTVVQDGDQLGSIYFTGADGTDATSYGAEIRGAVDGTPGSNDMPGKLVFYTTADGAVSGTERMRIDSNGYVTKPTNINFRATNLNNATGSTTLSDENQIFYSADWNIGSCYDTSNGKFTAPVTGKYMFIAHIIYNTTGDTTHAIYWKRNGSRFLDQHFCSRANAWDGMSYTALMAMAANDYMEFQHSAAASHGGSWSHLMGWLVQ